MAPPGCGRRLCARAARCVPRSTSFLTAVILMLIYGLGVTAVFGRSLAAVILGGCGIIASLEAIAHIARREYWVLPWYAGYLTLQVAASLAVGVSAIVGAGTFCAGADNTNVCTNVQVVYGLVMALGSSTAGLFAAINSIAVFYAVRGGADPAAGEEAHKLLL